MGDVELQFAWSIGNVTIGVLLAVAAAILYGVAERRREGRARVFGLTVTRAAILALIVLALSEPRLRFETENELPLAQAVLIDVSASMNRADATGATHADRARATLERWRQSAIDDGENSVHVVALDGQAREVSSIGNLRFDRPYSPLGESLAHLGEQVDALGLGSVTIVTDGGLPFTTAERTELTRLRERNVPVHVATTFDLNEGGPATADIEVQAVDAPGRVFAGSSVQVAARLAATGDLAAARTVVRLEVDGVVVATRELDIANLSSDQAVAVDFEFVARTGGVSRIEVVVPAADGESNVLNNRDTRLLRVIDTPINVLHVEGEPRFEVKFLRRAVHGDTGIRLVSLVRTAENKIYRLGVRDRDELRDGFPLTPEALFEFDVIVLGSVPADFFQPEQLALLPEFVARRGGGMMFLGGRGAFAEGGHQETSIQQMLPFVLQGTTSNADASLRGVMTPEAEQHPVARLGLGSPKSRPLASLPRLTSVNASVGGLAALKLGAQALWLGAPEAGGPARLLLAEQRFGRGRVAAFPVRDSYRWQLDRTVPVDDLTHEQFWRQWIRWLALSTPSRQQLEVDKTEVAPGETITLSARTLDARHHALDAGSTELMVVTPGGERIAVPLVPAGQAGLATAQFVPNQPGLHEFEMSVRTPEAQVDEAVSVISAFADVHQLGREMFSDQPVAERLNAIARMGGGQFVALDSLKDLKTSAPTTPRVVTSSRWVELWNSPWLVGLLLGLILIEWLARRRWKLP
mgnify:CR=1 FL=1